MTRIRWTPLAVADLKAISGFHRVAAQSCNRQSDSRTIYGVVQTVRRFPDSGRTGIREGTRELVTGSYCHRVPAHRKRWRNPSHLARRTGLALRRPAKPSKFAVQQRNPGDHTKPAHGVADPGHSAAARFTVRRVNVLSEEQKQRAIAVGRLGWSLRRIQRETHIRRETAGRHISKSPESRSVHRRMGTTPPAPRPSRHRAPRLRFAQNHL